MKPFEGEKGKGGEDPRIPIEHRNTLYSRTTAKILEAFSEGPCYGLADQANPSKSVYFDDVPLQNSDGTFNFEGVEIEERKGSTDQPWMEGFEEGGQTVAVGERVEKTDPATYTEVQFTGYYDSCRVTMQIPSLTYLDAGTGDLLGSSITFTIEWQAASQSYAWHQVTSIDEATGLQQNFIRITGKNTSPYEWSTRFSLWDYYNLSSPLQTEETFTIRVKRISNNTDEDSKKTGDLTFQRYRKIIDNKFQYPDTAYIGLKIDGWLFGDQVLGRTYDYKGLMLRVPSNYNPDTRTYTGTWDGTFKEAWSDNPAWATFELLTNPRWGLGNELSEGQINKWKLYEIAQYCDGVVASGSDMVFQGVPDGKGGFEPRFTMNAYVTKSFDAYSIVSLFASTFQGMVYWGSGTVEFTQDSPDDPVGLYNESNVIGGLFNRSGSSVKSKFTVINVTWENPANQHQAEVEVVEDPQMITRYGQRIKDVIAFGCTSQGQARRYGKLLLENERYGEAISWETGLDGARLRPGDIVKVQDPSVAGELLSGRIKSAISIMGIESIQLDGNYNLVTSVDYGYIIHNVLPDGVVTALTVRSTGSDPSTGNTVILCIGGYSVHPLAGSAFMLELPNLVPEQVRIVSVRPSTNAKYDIAGVLYDAGKYGRVEDGLSTPPPITSDYPTEAVLPPVTNITVTEYLYRDGPTVKTACLVGWTAGIIPWDGLDINNPNLPDPRVTKYEVQWRNPFTAKDVTDTAVWENIPSGTISSGFTLDVLDTQYGLYSFRVRAKDQRFRTSQWVETEAQLLNSLTLPPDDVTDFNGYVSGETMNLTFSPVTNLDLDHYQVRFSPKLSGVSWAEGQILSNSVPSNARTFAVPASSGTYLIKAVDQQNDFSVNATLFSSNMGSIFSYNVVETFLENDSQWTGTMVETEEVIDAGSSPSTYSLYLTADANTEPMDNWGVMDNVITLNYGTDYNGYGIYYFNNQTDLGYVLLSRVSYDMLATMLNRSNVMTSWSSLSSLDNMAGVVEDQAQIIIEVSISELAVTVLDAQAKDSNGIVIETGDPLTGWGNWQTLIINNYRARSFRYRLILVSVNAEVTPIINNCTITVDMPDREITNDALLTSSASGDTLIYFAPNGPSDNIGNFRGPVAPSIGITMHNAGSGDYFEVSNVTVDGFTFNVYASGGTTRVEKTFDWVAKGYGTVQ